jgi:hypothetical protein
MDRTFKHPFLERSHIAEPVCSQVNKCLIESCAVTGTVQTMHRLGMVDFVTLAGLRKMRAAPASDPLSWSARAVCQAAFGGAGFCVNGRAVQTIARIRLTARRLGDRLPGGENGV